MKIIIASDHRGFEMKNTIISWLKSKQYEVIDCGPEKYDSQDDYVDYANIVAMKIQSAQELLGGGRLVPRSLDEVGMDSPEVADISIKRQNTSKVARSDSSDGKFGILICGSGIGMSIAANRHKGIRAGLGFNNHQVQHARENDDINVLVLASDYTGEQEAKEMIDIFLSTKAKQDKKYLRRSKKLDKE